MFKNFVRALIKKSQSISYAGSSNHLFTTKHRNFHPVSTSVDDYETDITPLGPFASTESLFDFTKMAFRHISLDSIVSFSSLNTFSGDSTQNYKNAFGSSKRRQYGDNNDPISWGCGVQIMLRERDVQKTISSLKTSDCKWEKDKQIAIVKNGYGYNIVDRRGYTDNLKLKLPTKGDIKPNTILLFPNDDDIAPIIRDTPYSTIGKYYYMAIDGYGLTTIGCLEHIKGTEKLVLELQLELQEIKENKKKGLSPKLKKQIAKTISIHKYFKIYTIDRTHAPVKINGSKKIVGEISKVEIGETELFFFPDVSGYEDDMAEDVKKTFVLFLRNIPTNKFFWSWNWNDWDNWNREEDTKLYRFMLLVFTSVILVVLWRLYDEARNRLKDARLQMKSHWEKNQEFMEKLSKLSHQQQLYTYTTVSKKDMVVHEKPGIEITSLIRQNDEIQKYVKGLLLIPFFMRGMCKEKKRLESIMEKQEKQLKIAQVLNIALLKYKQRNYLEAKTKNEDAERFLIEYEKYPRNEKNIYPTNRDRLYSCVYALFGRIEHMTRTEENWKEERKYYEKAKKHTPNNAIIISVLAMLHGDKDNKANKLENNEKERLRKKAINDKKEQLHRKALFLAPNNPVVLVNWAAFLGKRIENNTKRKSEFDMYVNMAFATYKQILKIKPEYITTYIQRGNLYIVMKEYKKALDDFNKVLKQEPMHIKALYKRAVTLGNLNRNPEALKDLCVAGYELIKRIETFKNPKLNRDSNTEVLNLSIEEYKLRKQIDTWILKKYALLDENSKPEEKPYKYFRLLEKITDEIKEIKKKM